MLKQPVEYWDTMIIYLIYTKFDSATKVEWEKVRAELTELPTTDLLINFLTKRCQVLEALQGSKRIVSYNKNNSRVANVVTQKPSCKFCKSDHPLHLCKKFLALSITDRISEISKLRLCKNCLRFNHATKFCKSISVCQICKQKHNTLLHIQNSDESPIADHSVPSKSSAEISNTEPTVGLNCSRPTKTRALLPTALVYVYKQDGNKTICRILLDSASQSNFLTQDMFGKLGFAGKRVNIPITGINNSESRVMCEVKVKLESMNNSFNCTIPCLVLPEITQHLPQTSFVREHLNIPNNIQLADSTFNKSGVIDLLLGAEIFWHILCIGQISLGKNLPVAQKLTLAGSYLVLFFRPKIILSFMV